MDSLAWVLPIRQGHLLGNSALRHAQGNATRAVFWLAGLTVFATLVSIGWMRHPLGLWRWRTPETTP